ncbi:glycosyltransferase [Parafrankia discariae]|uniref:glycosyltransferase n=1 Tax=Parafrankia discariae TaxID=365528 RepID=UPI001E612EB9|nr:glycosyltransferase [Parafrankia discariae]
MSCALPDSPEPKSAGPGGPSDHPPRGTAGAAPVPLAGRAAGVAGARPEAVALLLGWCGVAVGISLSDGRYSPLALVMVLLGCLAVALAVAVPIGRAGRGGWGGGGWGGPRVRVGRGRPRGLPSRAAGVRLACASCGIVVAAGPILRHPRYYAHGPAAAAADVLAAAAGLLAGLALLRCAVPSGGRWAYGPAAGRAPGGRVFWVVLGLALAAGVATVVAAPQPRIDVFHLLQVSTSGLARGTNMYRQQWGPDRASYTAGGLFDVYPYLPGTSLLLAPFRWVLGDVRYGLLAALALAAVAGRALTLARVPGRAWDGAGGVGGGGGVDDGGGGAAVAAAGLLPLLVVVFPESMYALQQSWTEPLLVALLAVMVWAVAAGRPTPAVVAFALALASKQHVALLLPLAACWPAFGPRRALAAAGLGAAVVAPWVVAAPGDFVDDAVRTNLGYPVLDHSLSIPGWAHHFGITLGFGVTAVVLGAAYLLAWRARGGATGFCAGSALVLLALDVMNKQTFFNHYTLPMGLLVLAVAAGGAAPRRAAAPPRRTAAPPQRRVENRSSEAPS